MKLVSMLKDVLESLFKKSSTQLYPFEKKEAPVNFRGDLYFDSSACSGCCLCVKDCPSKAIEMVALDRAAKKFVLKYHMDRCVHCGQCVVNCRFKCLGMSSTDWENAALNKKEFVVYYGKDEDVAQFLAGVTAPLSDGVEK